jgi:hypothetical protein
MPTLPPPSDLRRFSHGGCREFAVALHERGAGTVAAYFHQPLGGDPQRLTHEHLIHAVVLTPGGQLMDARGWHERQDVEAEMGREATREEAVAFYTAADPAFAWLADAALLDQDLLQDARRFLSRHAGFYGVADAARPGRTP